MEEPTFLALTTVGWTAIYALLTAGLLLAGIAAAIYAAKQVKLARDQQKEFRLAQLEASRPYVVVSAEPSQASQQLFDLAITNIGKRPALNVVVSLHPPPVRANETQGHEMANAKMLNEPIAMIAPGQELRAFYDSHIDRNGRDDLPRSHEVQLEYADSTGRLYQEESSIDLDAMKGTLHARVYTLHDLGKSLDQIHKILKNASLLGRRGELETEVAVETRRRRLQRQRHEHTRRLLGHAELIRRVTPHHATEAGRILRSVPRGVRIRRRIADRAQFLLTRARNRIRKSKRAL